MVAVMVAMSGVVVMMVVATAVMRMVVVVRRMMMRGRGNACRPPTGIDRPGLH